MILFLNKPSTHSYIVTYIFLLKKNFDHELEIIKRFYKLGYKFMYIINIIIIPVYIYVCINSKSV